MIILRNAADQVPIELRQWVSGPVQQSAPDEKIRDRLRLLKMDDIQAPPIGTLGTVSGIDDTGSIMVRWDNGSGLFVVYGEDVVEKVP